MMYSDSVNDALLHPWNSLNTYESIRDTLGNVLWNFRHITTTAPRSLSRKRDTWEGGWTWQPQNIDLALPSAFQEPTAEGWTTRGIYQFQVWP